MPQVTDPNLLKQLGPPPVAPAPAGPGYQSMLPADPMRMGEARRAESAEGRAAGSYGMQQQMNRIEVQQREMALAASRLAAQQAADKAAIIKNAGNDAIYQIRNVTKAAREAQAMSRRGAGGWRASFGLNTVPESDARALRNRLKPVQSNTAFDTLQKMRAASPTGGALGAVSERELDLLQSTIANLDQLDKPENLQAGLQDVIDTYERVLFKLPAGQRDFKKRAIEMIGKGDDLPTIKDFFEQHGKTFTPDNEAWVQRGITAQMRKRGGMAGAPAPAPRAAPLQAGSEADRWLQHYGAGR